MEIEAKYTVADPAAFVVLEQLDQAGAYRLRAGGEVERQHNTYYDTADRRLQRAFFGLRVRKIGERAIVTLKGRNSAEGGLHRRDEWELEAASPDPATWPESEARRQALALLGEGDETAPLLALLTIHTERRHLIAERDEVPVAEISLDSGTIYAAGKTQSICELEIELLPDGVVADIEALAAALGAYLELFPENRSKLERGMALLEGVT